MTNETNKLIARNLAGVRVGDTLTIKNGEVFKKDQKVSTDLTRRVAPDGDYVVARRAGTAPGDVGYYAHME